LKQKLVITDLTQMPVGNQVCVVGITEDGKTIRPVHPSGFLKSYLYNNNDLVVCPRAKVEWDFTQDHPVPPHIEDKLFIPNSLKYYGKCDDKQWEQYLLKVSFKTVKDIYQGYLCYNHWVAPGSPTRSIATLIDAKIQSLNIIETEKSVRSRLIFHDISNNKYDLPISDLAFREMTYMQIKRKLEKAEDVSDKIINRLLKSKFVYLRIGLARPWKSTSSEGYEHCYCQITGIHTFPDYLDGKNFTDFTIKSR